MSADNRDERYDWDDQDSMEIVEQGTGQSFRIDELTEDGEEETELEPVGG